MQQQRHKNSGPDAHQSPCAAVLLQRNTLEAMRRQMVQFAAKKLSDPHAAEDVVQEALVGALKNARFFTGGSTVKTWMFAILKNKIVDNLRQRMKLREVQGTLDEHDEYGNSCVACEARSLWSNDAHTPARTDPVEALRLRQFWEMFEQCLQTLPPQQSTVFVLREVIELDASEICNSVGITTTHLHVMLHRARRKLRTCVQSEWHNRPVENTACTPPSRC